MYPTDSFGPVQSFVGQVQLFVGVKGEKEFLVTTSGIWETEYNWGILTQDYGGATRTRCKIPY